MIPVSNTIIISVEYPVFFFFPWFKGSPEYEHTCGRPLGIRVGPNGTLFVTDAYLGLFEVNPVTGKEIKSVLI